MGNITVANNTSLPVNVATSWAGIVQKYENQIAPGANATLEGLVTGWQDIAVAPWAPGFEFNHGSDWVAAVGLGATTLGVVLAPFTGGASLAISIAGGATTIGGVVASVASQALSPAQLRGVPARAAAISLDVRGWQVTVDDSDPPQVTAISDLELRYSVPAQGLERALSGSVRSGEVKGL